MVASSEDEHENTSISKPKLTVPYSSRMELMKLLLLEIFCLDLAHNQVVSHYPIRSYLLINMNVGCHLKLLWIEGYCNEKYNYHLLQSIRNHQSLHHWWSSITRVIWSCRLTMSLKTPPFQIQSWLFLPAQGWSLWNCYCWRFSVLNQSQHSLPTPWWWFPELV